MDPSTSSPPARGNAAPGEGTLTREIRRTEALVRLFQIDSTIEVLLELPAIDPRREPLLKFWSAHREQLASYVNLNPVPCFPVSQFPPMAMLPNDHHPGPRCSCADCLRRYPSA